MRLHVVALAALTLLVIVPRTNSCEMSCGMTSDVSPDAVFHLQVDGRPLLSAHVTINSASRGIDTLFSGTPGADGTIHLKNMPIGQVFAHLDLWGLQSTVCFVVSASGNAIHDLNLVPEFGLFRSTERSQIEKSPMAVLLYSYPDGTLPGFQKNDGEYLTRKGIRFTLQDAFNGTAYDAVTDAASHITLSAPAGPYVLRITVDGIQTKFSFFVRLVDPSPDAPAKDATRPNLSTQPASEKSQHAGAVIYMRYRNLGDCGDHLELALNPKQQSDF
jgi:hypothetical protein